MIGIIDYDMGNLYSVSKALERLEIPYFISKNIDELMEADGYILPGVGAFPDAMKTLQETGLQAFLDTKVYQKKPLLGICLGMQLLFESSEEYGQTRGLAYLPGTVERFSGNALNGDAYKVPHMGWNELIVKKRKHLSFSFLLTGMSISFIRTWYEPIRLLLLQRVITIKLFLRSSKKG